MINTKRPNTNDYTQVGFIEAEDNQGNYQNIDHIYDSEGNIVFQQGYLNEYDGANDFRIPAIGKPLIDYTIYGNAVQDGIPTSGNPIMPQGTGERTGNWFDIGSVTHQTLSPDGTISYESAMDLSGYIKVNGDFTVSWTAVRAGAYMRVSIYDDNKTFIERVTAKNTYNNTQYSYSHSGYIRINYENSYGLTNIMLNSGSTPLPYEPYGYKIPIMAGKYEFLEEPLRAVKTYKDTIDLGTKLLTRQIKELVLTGEEAWQLWNGNYFSNVIDRKGAIATILCTHFINSNTQGISYDRVSISALKIASVAVPFVTSVNDLKAWLAAQYAAGTPVTVWYALAEPIVTTLSLIPDGLRGIIEGKGSQLSTPSPSNPIEPVFYGERTGNLLSEFYATSGEIQGNSYTITKNSIETHNDGRVLGSWYVLAEFKRYGNYANYTPIDEKHSFKIPAGTYTFSGNENIHSGNNGLRLIVGQLGQTMAGATGGAQNIGVGQTFTITEDSYVCPVLEIRYDSRVDEYILTNPMLNTGSTPLKYEPYGYKIPISLNQHSILLDESLKAIGNYKDTLDLSTGLLTRRVKELILTGEENWTYESQYSRFVLIRTDAYYSGTVRTTPCNCSHYQPIYDGRTINNVPNESIYITPSSDKTAFDIKSTDFSAVTDFKSYLAAQYAAGTPVTIWYILTEPTTETISIPSGLTGIIEGVGIQNGTPTPDNPIMPVGKGERTGNLFDKDATDTNNGYMNSKYIGYDGNIGNSANHNISEYIAIPVGAEHLTISNVSQSTIVYCQFYDNSKNAISIFRYDTIPRTVSIPSNAKYIRCSISKVQMSNFMLNSGSTPLPYEPYGYKIPISSANTTTPIYLGEVQTTRKIKKYIFDGTEQWQRTANGAYYLASSVTPITDFWHDLSITSVNSHFAAQENVTGSSSVADNKSAFYGGSALATKEYYIAARDIADATDFKTYLQQQYSSGTPVTVWYILTTEETAVVNDPLMRIGDYADSVDFSQAGVEIPTLKRPNTTEIDITTSLPPSEVYAKYRGSKTQKYDLFLAANGDSFEAKNGQSLYIGDDA